MPFLYKILFHFEAFVHESIIRVLPPRTCIAGTIAIPLHVYCAIYDAPPTPLVYAVHHTISEMAISCKGQRMPGCVIACMKGRWALKAVSFSLTCSIT